MALIVNSTGIRSGNPCRNDGGLDSLPCDSECTLSLALADHLYKLDLSVTSEESKTFLN